MTMSKLMHPTTMAGLALAVSLMLLMAVILGLA